MSTEDDIRTAADRAKADLERQLFDMGLPTWRIEQTLEEIDRQVEETIAGLPGSVVPNLAPGWAPNRPPRHDRSQNGNGL